MVGQTRASPNGFGASGSDAPPPPPNMTIQEQFMVTQTEVMRQLLQTQQQLAQQLQNNPCGRISMASLESPNMTISLP
jgi:hypothetical protein